MNITEHQQLLLDNSKYPEPFDPKEIGKLAAREEWSCRKGIRIPYVSPEQIWDYFIALTDELHTQITSHLNGED